MNKRQIARKLVDTEAGIKVLEKRLKIANQKATRLQAELENPPAIKVRILEQKESEGLRGIMS